MSASLSNHCRVHLFRIIKHKSSIVVDFDQHLEQEMGFDYIILCLKLVSRILPIFFHFSRLIELASDQSLTTVPQYADIEICLQSNKKVFKDKQAIVDEES